MSVSQTGFNTSAEATNSTVFQRLCNGEKNTFVKFLRECFCLYIKLWTIIFRFLWSPYLLTMSGDIVHGSYETGNSGNHLFLWNDVSICFVSSEISASGFGCSPCFTCEYPVFCSRWINGYHPTIHEQPNRLNTIQQIFMPYDVNLKINYKKTIGLHKLSKPIV